MGWLKDGQAVDQPLTGGAVMEPDDLVCFTRDFWDYLRSLDAKSSLRLFTPRMAYTGRVVSVEAHDTVRVKWEHDGIRRHFTDHLEPLKR